MTRAKLLSFIARSKKREIILRALEKPKTPTKIAFEFKLHRSHVSRTIIEFQKKDLVKCLTPNERMGRLYQLTPRGKKILSDL